MPGKKESLTITDNRTGKTYEVPILYGTYPTYGAAVKAMDLRQIKVSEADFGLLSLDPSFMNTASCKSSITFIDGEKGILRYRGYPIDELARKSSFLEVAYLILEGELPSRTQLDEWTQEITYHTMMHESLKRLMDGFRCGTHPMGSFIGTVAALSTFYPESKDVRSKENRMEQIVRLIAKMPTIAAFAYRHSMGYPYVYPDNDLSYAGNFLNMMFKMAESKYRPDPAIERVVDVLFTLHADHEQNCSTNVIRGVGSSLADPYVAVAAAAAALYGPLHGGANEHVLHMLAEIGSKDKVPHYIERVKKGEFRLMGFGHRVYKHYDPRATVLKELAPQVFEVTGKSALLDIALELERIAMEDEYFLSRKLYPNVDFYSGIICQAIGFPVGMFPVLFAIARVVGWVAQWQEMLEEPDQKIARPRQVYTGADLRNYVAVEKR
jgi:citrate synthase